MLFDLLVCPRLSHFSMFSLRPVLTDITAAKFVIPVPIPPARRLLLFSLLFGHVFFLTYRVFGG